MKKRLESFKSTKFGRKQAKHMNKNYKRDRGQRRNSSMYMLQNGSITNESNIYEMDLDPEETMECDTQLDGSITFLTSLTENKGNVDPASGFDNPAFSSDEEQNVSMKFAPWLYNEDAVVPSQRAQIQMPYSPNNLRRLTPFRISSRSADSFSIADGAEEQPRSFLPETNM